ncbi:MAG: hypothetical protein ABWY57_15945 [Mycetocola sp.]
MADTSCARCGQSPIFLAACAMRAGLTAYYCHGEDTKDPTCYTLSTWANYPELEVTP